MKKILEIGFVIILIVLAAINVVQQFLPTSNEFKFERMTGLSFRAFEGVAFAFFILLLGYRYFMEAFEASPSGWFLILFLMTLAYFGSLFWLEKGLQLALHVSAIIFFIASQFKLWKIESKNKKQQITE